MENEKSNAKTVITVVFAAVWVILLVALYILFPISDVYTGEVLSTYEIIPSVLFFTVGILGGVLGMLLKSKPMLLLSLFQELMALVCIVLLGIFIFTESATVLFVFLNIANPFAFLLELHSAALFFVLAAVQIILPLASFIIYKIKVKKSEAAASGK